MGPAGDTQEADPYAEIVRPDGGLYRLCDPADDPDIQSVRRGESLSGFPGFQTA